MKQVCLFLLLGLVLAAFSNVAYAEVIEGNASSDVTVNNDVQGSGEVHTHIESTVNGQTKVLNSNQPGIYTLHNSSSQSASSTQSSSVTITAQLTATPTAKPKLTYKPTQTSTDPIHAIENYFHNFIQKILALFHL